MNTNITLTCDVCEQDTDCRIGYSNREVQPLSFACLHCSSLIQITLNIENAPRSDFKFKGCQPSENQPETVFDGTNPFVDLHLDFPVRFGKYVMGDTPYMMVVKELHESSEDASSDLVSKKMDFINSRLDQLNYFHDKSDEIRTIIRLYSGENKQLFKKRVGDFLGEEQGDSLEPQDVNASLYLFVSTVFRPFIHFEEAKEANNLFSDLTTHLPTDPLNVLVKSNRTLHLENFHS